MKFLGEGSYPKSRGAPAGVGFGGKKGGGGGRGREEKNSRKSAVG